MTKSQLKIKIVQIFEIIFGKLLVQKLLFKKYLRVYNKCKIIFVHIPKAAGTSIAFELYGKRNGHLSATQIRSGLGQEIYFEKFSFSVSRNPYDRLVS